MLRLRQYKEPDTDVFQMAMSILRRTLTHDRIYKIRKNI